MAFDFAVEHPAADDLPDEEAVEYWLAEITAAKKREKDFRKQGQRVIDIYESEKVGAGEEQTAFNILYSNVETLQPALFSQVPRPIVLRRFKDDDPLGKAAADAGRRVLEFEVDTNREGYETYEEAMQAATLDGLLPGRGWTCVKFHAAMEEMPEMEATTTTPYLQSEMVCLETRAWDRVLHGYAKTWSKVPWIAYEEHIDRREATRLFGEAVASQLIYSKDDTQRDHEDEQHTQGSTSGHSDRADRDTGQKKTVLIYQIWDKAGGRKIRYLIPQYKEGLGKVEDDPLGLTGFFNCPKPLCFYLKSHNLTPTAPYLAYEEQAKELNRLTRRLRRVVEALKVRGVYAGDLSTELSKLMKEEDNGLVPAESTSTLAFEKGLQNAIWMMPLQDLVIVAEKLYQAREACKQVIYEITGISDIIRGATKASETYGAQQLKSQWGTLRLKRCQREVQRYARDLLRMMLEISATKFSEETWATMTGLPFTTQSQHEQAQAIVQAAPLGQAPDPQALALLQRPLWTDVLKLLQDDVQRAYRVDIETNSTLEPEAAEDHKDITEMLTAMGQTLNGLAPLIESGSMPFQAAQALLLAIARRFRFGSEIEDYVKAMQPPQQNDQGKAQAEQARLTAEAQRHAADLHQQTAIETAKHTRALQAEQNRMAFEQQKLQVETEREHARLASALRIEQVKAMETAKIERVKIQLENNAKMAMAKLEAETKIVVAEIAAKASIKQTAMTRNTSAEGQAAETALTETGETIVKGPIADLLASVHANMQTFLETHQADQRLLIALLTAPKVVERDPKTGRALRVVTQGYASG